MKIEATKYALTIQYKEAGKFYGLGTDAAPGIPFEEKRLEVGESFVVPGSLVAIREHTPVPETAVAVGSGNDA